MSEQLCFKTLPSCDKTDLVVTFVLSNQHWEIVSNNLMTRSPEVGDDDGFTLIELLIVIVVLGILAAVVVFALANVNSNARQTSCIADAKTVETAVGAFNAQLTPAIGVETTGTSAGDITVGTPQTYPAGTQAQLLLTNNYLKSWPMYTNGYAVSLSTTVAGDVSIYVPATSLSPTDYEHESSSTGCNNSAI